LIPSKFWSCTCRNLNFLLLGSRAEVLGYGVVALAVGALLWVRIRTPVLGCQIGGQAALVAQTRRRAAAVTLVVERMDIVSIGSGDLVKQKVLGEVVLVESGQPSMVAACAQELLMFCTTPLRIRCTWLL
jgi:hypothetical protein